LYDSIQIIRPSVAKVVTARFLVPAAASQTWHICFYGRKLVSNFRDVVQGFNKDDRSWHIQSMHIGNKVVVQGTFQWRDRRNAWLRKMRLTWFHLCLQQLQGWDSTGTYGTFSRHSNWIGWTGHDHVMNLLVVVFLQLSCTCGKSSYIRFFLRIRDSFSALWEHQCGRTWNKSSDRGFAKNIWLWVTNLLWSCHEWKWDVNANAVYRW